MENLHVIEILISQCFRPNHLKKTFITQSLSYILEVCSLKDVIYIIRQRGYYKNILFVSCPPLLPLLPQHVSSH